MFPSHIVECKDIEFLYHTISTGSPKAPWEKGTHVGLPATQTSGQSLLYPSGPFSIHCKPIKFLGDQEPSLLFLFLFFFRFCICWSAYHTQFTKSLKQPGYRQQIFPDLVRRSALPGSPLWSFLAPASDPTQGELEDLTRLLRNLVWSSSTPVFFLHFEIDYHLIL